MQFKLYWDIWKYKQRNSGLMQRFVRFCYCVPKLLDKMMIEHAVSGVDAVISVLGSRGGSKDKPIMRGMQNIIAAMNKYGVRRLIVSSTLSVKDPNDLSDFKSKVLVKFVKLTMRAAYEEIISVAETVSV